MDSTRSREISVAKELQRVALGLRFGCDKIDAYMAALTTAINTIQKNHSLFGSDGGVKKKDQMLNLSAKNRM